MSNYLYHRVPKDLVGNVLYPLNELKISYPDIYTKQAAKYDSRKNLMELTIPILDCLWNDVLHLSPIEPAELKTAFMEAGMSDREMSFFQIDPTDLDHDLAVIYKYTNREKVNVVNSDDFMSFTTSTITPYRHLPPETKDYYINEYQNGRKPLLFHGVAHILYKNNIDITNSPIITV